MSQLQTTAIIRAKGQLTIPQKIRGRKSWASSGSVVTLVSEKPDEITIRPANKAKDVDWKKLWLDIRRVRSYKGRGGGNLSKFIARDRLTRK